MAAQIMLSVLFGGFVLLLAYLYESLVLKSKRLRSKLEKQGIRGPSPSSILLGNIPDMNRIKLKEMKLRAAKETRSGTISKDHPLTIVHDLTSTLFPHLVEWRNDYGPNFTYLSGRIQQLTLTDVETVKEVSLCKSLHLGRPAYILSQDRKPLFGKGILASNGPIWSHQRKIIAPEFYFEKVKGMMDLMVDSTTTLLRSWESKIESEGGIAVLRVDEDMRCLLADIISRACFGSNYSEGKEIFLKLRTLQRIMSQGNIGVPGVRYLPTKNNREAWRLEKEIHSMILKVAKQRSTEASHEKDLLQMILEGAKNYGDADSLFSGISQDNFIVDNCKNIYFAGHETSAVTTSWSLMLLAANPEWQARARAEVLEICRDGVPDADALRSMKTLNMVIQETLRLYPPAVFVVRQAFEDIELNNILIPKGTNIQIPVPMLQQLPDVWGPDALEFNPKRFEHGVLGACKFPQAYIPFGFGPRICVGQHLAMTEMKVILSLILSKFCFSLSPAYQHCPAFRLVIEPDHGLNLHVRRVTMNIGPNFTYLSGSIQQLAVIDLNLGKPGYVSKDRKSLFGQGIIAANGPIWYHQRKIIAPEFYFDRVKGMVELMVDCTTTMLRSCESKIEGEGGIAVFGVDEDLRSFSADIISRTSFGSVRYLATKNNREIWRLEKEIHSMILRVAKQRSAEATYEKDLLQMIIEGAKNYGDTDSLFSGISQDNFIVDNCKSMYFAGHETTAITASWSLMLLAAYPEWQARARAEVLGICMDRIPDADMLRSMRILNMVIQEALRLYAPSMFVGREALDDIELNGILIPKGTNMKIPIPILHRLPDIWGPDALDFNPKRFEHGILGACKFPQAYMPFGVGARICLGQHLAMTELKVILSLILSKFCFTLSPAYQHCPTASMVIEPEHGVSLQVRRV